MPRIFPVGLVLVHHLHYAHRPDHDENAGIAGLIHQREYVQRVVVLRQRAGDEAGTESKPAV